MARRGLSWQLILRAEMGAIFPSRREVVKLSYTLRKNKNTRKLPGRSNANFADTLLLDPDAPEHRHLFISVLGDIFLPDIKKQIQNAVVVGPGPQLSLLMEAAPQLFKSGLQEGRRTK